MAIQLIDEHPTYRRDGTGDSLEKAFNKCNDNFTELYASQVPVLNALAAGIVADGSTDQSSAIETLLNTTAPTSGARVVFPAASNAYMILSPIDVTRSNLIIELQPGATIKAQSGWTGDASLDGMFNLGGTSDTLSNLSIVGGGQIDGDATASKGIGFRGAQSNIRIDGIEVYNTINTAMDLRGNINDTDTSLNRITGVASSVFTATAHGWSNGDRVIIYSIDGLPSPLVIGQWYYVVNATANTFQLAYTPGGSAITLKHSGNATKNLYAQKWTYTSKDVAVRNCRVIACGEGIQMQGIDQCSMTGNYLEDLHTQDGLETSNVVGLVMTGNRVYGSGVSNSGIDCFNNLINATVSDNIVTGRNTTFAGTSGMGFNSGSSEQHIKHNVTIANNQVSGTYQSGISFGVSEFSQVLLIGNNTDVFNAPDNYSSGALFSSWGPGCKSIGNTYRGELYGMHIFAADYPMHSVADSFLGRRDRGIYPQASADNGEPHIFESPNFLVEPAAGNASGQQYYIRATDGTVKYNIYNAVFPNTGTSGVHRVSSTGNTGGSNQKYINCSGFLTRNTGVATLANGTTSIAVTHQLGDLFGITPHDITPNRVLITPQESLGSATKFWVSAIGATTFVINVDADPGADVDFAWEALQE